MSSVVWLDSHSAVNTAWSSSAARRSAIRSSCPNAPAVPATTPALRKTSVAPGDGARARDRATHGLMLAANLPLTHPGVCIEHVLWCRDPSARK